MVEIVDVVEVRMMVVILNEEDFWWCKFEKKVEMVKILEESGRLLLGKEGGRRRPMDRRPSHRR